MMFNPGQSQSGGLGSALAQGSGVPDDQFARLATQSMQQTGVTPIAMLADLARRITAKKNAMMNQGLQAGAQMARKPATLKDEIDQEALALGIGSQPYGYAGGGLVAFQYGGKAEEEPLTTEDVESAGPADLMAQFEGSTYADTLGFGATPETIALDALRVANTLQERERREIKERYDFLKDAAPDTAARMLRENPWLDPDRSAPPLRGAPTPAAARPSAAPTATRPPATRSPATRPPADTPPAAAPAVPADIAEYTKAANAGIAGMEGRGKVTPEELQLREALLAAQQAERQQPVEYKEPEGLTTREMLQLASFDPTKGKWMGSLAEKAAGVMSAREAKAEEAKKANREIDAANRKLNTALAQQRLAYSVGDRQAREAADQAVLNARIALREKVIDFGFKSSDTESRRISAEAARAAANQRTSGGMTDAQKAQMRDKATDNITKDPQLPARILRAEQAAKKDGKPFDREAFVADLIERETARLMGTAPAAPSSGAGTAPAERSGWTVQEVK
jgi:hypothetical protein